MSRTPPQPPEELRQPKQMPLPGRPLTLPAPYDFVEVTLASDVALGEIAEFARMQRWAADAEDTDENLQRVWEGTARLFNQTILAWNLHEYARPDGQPFSPAGQITPDDVRQMGGKLLDCMRTAALSKDAAADEATKKSSTPGSNGAVRARSRRKPSSPKP